MLTELAGSAVLALRSKPEDDTMLGWAARVLAGRLCSATALVLFSCCIAHADIRVRVSFAFIEDEIFPNATEHRSNRAIDYTLHGHAADSRPNTGRSVAGDFRRSVDAVDDSGGHYKTRMDIRGHAFVVRSDFPSFVFTTRILTKGVNASSATREARLKPGHRYFEETRVSNGEAMRLASLRYEDITCSIDG